jgi:tRNA G18 (ribose-2'-O)-methylase SpoU
MDGTILIDDADDPRVADFRRINEQAERRRMERDEFFLSEGWMSIERLIESGHAFRSVLLSPSRVPRFRPFTARPELAGVQVHVAERDVMREIVGFDMPRAVLVSARRRPLASVEDLVATSRRLIVLEALNDDENVGAIARAARAFDIDGMVLDPTCNDPYHRRTVRVSMGEILHMRVARATPGTWPGVLDVLHDAGFETWGMTPDDAAVDLWRATVPERLAIVLGAEGPGLTPDVLDGVRRQVRIPISPVVDSLNVGHAAAITLAAISRPRDVT